MIPLIFSEKYSSPEDILRNEGFKPECDGWYKNSTGAFYYVEVINEEFYVSAFSSDPRPKMAKVVNAPVITNFVVASNNW